MKVEVILIGAKAVLVPYTPDHVETYHAWMQDEALLQLTCSEKLTLQEERENQTSWTQDPSKLTFIVTAPESRPESLPQNLTDHMCGDVNAFFSEIHPDYDENDEAGEIEATSLSAELEVMIADPKYRRRGIAREAIQMLMHYILSNIQDVAEFVVKVGDTNEPSLRLFKELGFAVRKELKVFEQIELWMPLDDARKSVSQSIGDVQILSLR